MKKTALTVSTALLFLAACSNIFGKTASNQNAAKNENSWVNYVSSDYFSRKQGYDWIAVRMKNISPQVARISIRSRADRKKPSCTFDGMVYKTSDGIYSANFGLDAKLLVTAADGKIKLATSGQQGQNWSYLHCSGGASFLGEYKKIDGKLDSRQLDDTDYATTLFMQNMVFTVRAKAQELTITPTGPTFDNHLYTQAYNGEIINTEIADLDNDGFPEILVYTAATNKKIGDVIGLSSNKNKSMSPFYFPPLNDLKTRRGYEGHDDFSVVENTLTRIFPIFLNGNPTGQYRQLNYKLKNAEAMKAFQLESVTDFD